jgi:hypothetical protein
LPDYQYTVLLQAETRGVCGRITRGEWKGEARKERKKERKKEKRRTILNSPGPVCLTLKFSSSNTPPP